MIEIFKTDVSTQCEANLIIDLLQRKYQHTEINFDLDDCDKVMRLQGKAFCCRIVIEMLAALGYQCSVLE